MNAIWQQITLATVPLYQWRQASFLYHWVGPLQRWRRTGLLMQWADEIGVLLLSLVFGLAPFITNTQIGVLLFACGAYWVLLTLSDEVDTDKPRTGFTPIHLLILLYWGIAAIATAMSPVKTAAFTGWMKLTLYLGLFALMARLLRSPRLRSGLITLYLLVSLLISVEGMRQVIFGATALATWVDPTAPDVKEIRVYSFLGNPNLLAGYLIPAIALSVTAVFVWRSWSAKLLALMMLGLDLSCLYFTRSRGGWIGLVFVTATLLVLLFNWWQDALPQPWRSWAIPIALGGFATLLLVAIVVVEPLRIRVLSIFAGRGDSSNNFRINVWMAVLDMIQSRPILGIGPGNTAFNKIYPLFQHPRYTALSAYSVLLEIAVETGLIGLSAFLWLLVVTLNQGWTQLQRLKQLGNRDGFWLLGAIATLVGMLGHGLVDTVWYRPEVSMLWWFAVALIASYFTVRPQMGSAAD
jgi:putative inorganic carbon (HCO3(-)) transporter